MGIGTITIGNAIKALGTGATGIGALGGALAGNLWIKNELNNAKNEALINVEKKQASEEIGEAAINSGLEESKNDNEEKNNWITNPKEPFTGWGNKEPLYLPSIQDSTNDNIEKAITGQGGQGILDWIEQQQKEQIALQEKWRQEEFARQDNAWQRAVADMRKAGVNPNLVNAQPAESGTATSQPAEKDYTIFSEYMGKLLNDLERETNEGKQPLEIIDTVSGAIQSLMIALTLAGKLK